MSNDLIISELQNAASLPSLHVIDFAPHQPVTSVFLDGLQNALYRLDAGKHNRVGDEIHTGIFSVSATPRPGSTDVARQIDLEGLNPAVSGKGSFLYVSYHQYPATSVTGYMNFSGALVANDTTVNQSPLFNTYFTLGIDKITCIKDCNVMLIYRAVAEGNSGLGHQAWTVETNIYLNNLSVAHDYNYSYGASGAVRDWPVATSVMSLAVVAGQELKFRQTLGGGSCVPHGQTLTVLIT